MNPDIILPWTLFAITWIVLAITMFFWNKCIDDFRSLSDEWFALADEQEKLIKMLLEKLKMKP